MPTLTASLNDQFVEEGYVVVPGILEDADFEPLYSEWNQILADITGLPAALSLEGQTTLRGTALIALEVLAADVVRPAAEVGNEYAPRLECSDAYREAARRQQEAYGCLVTRA